MVNDHCEFSKVRDASPRYGDDSRSIIGIRIFNVNYHRYRLNLYIAQSVLEADEDLSK